MLEQEYSTEELEELVATALGQVSNARSRALFNIGDTRLFEVLDTVLAKYVSQKVDVDSILDELRDELYDGYRTTNTSKELRSLHGMMSACTACPNAASKPHMPHWNLLDPDVVFVTDTPLTGSPADQLFIDTLKEVGFRSSRICATSVVRCFPEAKITSNMVSNCIKRHLYQELTLLQPRLIVACGKLSCSVFFGSDVKLADRVGRTAFVGPNKIFTVHSPASTIHSDRNASDFNEAMHAAYKATYG